MSLPTSELEEYYEKIGGALFLTLTRQGESGYLRFEVQVGVYSYGFYIRRETGLYYETGVTAEKSAELLYELWEKWNKEAEKPWYTATFIVHSTGKFECDFGYDKWFESDVSHPDRRNSWIKRYFGEIKVIYPTPPK
ncbi:MAG: antitoxin YezG family protein [Acidobacteria bacterium]|nr:antitoxin YezG family protein [Acidobacteriota bacterium]